MKDLTNKKFNMLTALYPLPERKNGRIVWHCRCDCGNECDVKGSLLTNNNTKSCGCLNNKKRAERFREYNENNRENLVGKIFNDNVLVIEQTRMRQNSNLLYKCKCLNCGKEWYVQSNNLKHTKSCGCLNSTNLVDLTGQKFGMLTVLDLVDTNDQGAKWRCKCDCGNETIVRASDLKRKGGGTFSCGCITRSIGELNIQKILEENNILYEEQRKFPTCISPLSNKLLSFDFCLPEYKCLIEADGKQHYQAIKYFGGEDNFEKQQKRDRYKEQWCKENNYTLIRIPYTHYREIVLEDLLPETSQFVISEEKLYEMI